MTAQGFDAPSAQRYAAKVMNRLAILLALGLASGFGATVLTTGCGSGPYSAKPDRLHHPRPKKRPDGKTGPTEVTDDDKGGDSKAKEDPCRTNFFAEPFKGRRRAHEARSLARQADQELVAADREMGPQRQTTVVGAMGTLSNALDKDPYGPEPTYKMAVAYAMVGKKSCALALLERLKMLQNLPEVEREAHRAIERAVRDPAFDSFEKEAKQAMGE